MSGPACRRRGGEHGRPRLRQLLRLAPQGSAPSHSCFTAKRLSQNEPTEKTVSHRYPTSELKDAPVKVVKLKDLCLVCTRISNYLTVSTLMSYQLVRVLTYLLHLLAPTDKALGCTLSYFVVGWVEGGISVITKWQLGLS